MKEHCELDPCQALIYYYFDFNDIENQTVSHLLSSLVAQLCAKAVDTPPQLKETYQRCNNGQQKASMQELKVMLAKLSTGYGDVFIIIIDAHQLATDRKLSQWPNDVKIELQIKCPHFYGHFQKSLPNYSRRIGGREAILPILDELLFEARQMLEVYTYGRTKQISS
jgi:hypothetical protein